MIPNPLAGKIPKFFDKKESGTSESEDVSENLNTEIQKEEQNSQDLVVSEIIVSDHPRSGIEKFILYFIEPEMDPKTSPAPQNTAIKPREKKPAVPINQQFRIYVTSL